MSNNDFRRYLAALGRLYREGIAADVEPSLLRRMGGALSLAARDAAWIRTEENGLLGVVDTRRSPAEVDRLARSRWLDHRAQIMEAIERGASPAAAVEQHFRSYTGTPPHSPAQTESMLQLQAGRAGTHSAWLSPIVQFRARYQRAGAVMTGSSITAIAAGMHFLATAEDWEQGTPEEWDRSLAFGEAVQPLAQLAEGAATLSQARSAPHPSTTSTRPEVVVVSSGTSGSAAARGTGVSVRGTGSAARGTGAAVRGGRRGPVAPLDTHEDLNFEAAFAGAFATSPMRGVDGQGRRLIDRGRRDASADHLDFANPRQRTRPSRTLPALSALGLTGRQETAARRMIGRRLDGRFLRCWQRAIDSRARQDRATVRRLERSSDPADQAQARRLARAVYDRVRGNFWRNVQADRRLSAMLADAGFTVPERAGQAPYYQMPGRREYLTLDHTGRVTDTPSASIQGNQLVFTLGRENSGVMEALRETGWEAARASAAQTAPAGH